MDRMIKIFFFTLLLAGILSGRADVLAQSVPGASGPTIDCAGSAAAYRAQGIPCDCVGGRIVCNNSSSGGSSSGKKYSADHDVKMMVVGTIFESLLTSLFMDDTASQKEALAAQQKAAALAAQQAAALERAKAAAAQAEYEKMMRFYKQLDGGGGAAFKTLSNSNLAFKTLDGDAETLAANARKPFDTPLDTATPDSGTITAGGATPFFGDTMPIEQIQLLVHPEKDPNVVDLRNATTYVVENIKNDGQKLAAAAKPDAGKGKDEPANRSLECEKLSQRLNGYIDQRAKFQKTIHLAQDQLTTWQTANRNALLNAAKEGLEVYTGHLLEKFTQRAKAAERLQRIYEKNAGKMAQDGLNVAEIHAKIERLRLLSSAGRIVELGSNINDWQAFIKDGVSGLMAQLTSSNQEIQAMIEDPRMQKYFETEAPELKALLDISKIAASNKVFGKWVAKKLPIIAGVEFAINQAYNAFDWYLSYERLSEAHKINGRVMNSARYIQKNIDDTYLALGECR
ncbi:MAG: hypothetical protein P1P89_02835 [Desulfobacterales bacterium]|nr:hypothetical protein [Desulfobacterales bacterium]